MSRVSQSFIPESTSSNEARVVKIPSSRLPHVLTALFFAVVTGGAIYAALYFAKADLIISVAGSSGGALLAGVITYVVLRTFFGVAHNISLDDAETQVEANADPHQSGSTPSKSTSTPLKCELLHKTSWNTTTLAWAYIHGRFWQDAAKRVNIITSVEKRLQENYGEIKSRDLKEIKQVIYNDETNELYTKEVCIFLATEQEFLNTPLKMIANYCDEERHAVIARLMWLEKHPRGDTHSADEGSKDTSTNELTLQQLRSLRGEALKERLLSIPPACLPLLSPEQAHEILTTKLSQDFNRLLPTELPSEAEYTQTKLAALPEKFLLKRMDNLTFEQLALLPITYVKKDEFPWKKFKEHPGNLLLLPLEMINDPSFPWDELSKINGIGTVLRALFHEHKKSLDLTRIDWDRISKKEAEVKALFDLEEKDELRSLISAIEITHFESLSRHLTAEHITFFKREQLQDSRFPWEQFLKKEGIGYSLAYFHTQTLASSHCPWDRFGKNEKELKGFIALMKGSYPALLNLLKSADIEPLAKHLSISQLSDIKGEHLNSLHFPWKSFAQVKGMGAKLRELALRKNDSLTLKNLPLKDLKLNYEEQKDLFKIDSYPHKEIKAILSQIDILDSSLFIQAWTAEHLEHFSMLQMSDVFFPWKDFFNKDLVGFYLRNVDPAVFHLPKFDWKVFLSKKEEVGFFLSLKSPDQLKTILNSLTPKMIADLGPFLTPQHLPLFENPKLKEPSFPWVYIFQPGACEIIKKLALKIGDPLSLNDIPWNLFIQKRRGEISNMFPFGDYDTQKLIKSLSPKNVKILYDANILGMHSNYFTDLQKEAVGIKS